MNTLSFQFTLDRPGFRFQAAIDAPAAGVTGVFGPSGSGKTTLLRCLAGLERGARGKLQFLEETWQDDAQGVFVPTHRRAIGYVFQEARLFPHLSVRRNLAYGARRAPGGADPQRLARIVELLGLQPLLDRYPHQVSGGEQQRVAIGRALLTRPRLLLMDEPMASLDQARKAEIMPYLENLHRELTLPVIYVSHAMEEIARLSDTLVLIEKGAIRAAGPLHEVLPRLDLPLAHAEDAASVLDATVAGHDERFHLTEVAFAGGRLTVPRQALPVGAPLRLMIHARDVSLALSYVADSSILNILEARVADIRQQEGGRTLVRLDVGGAPLLARITRKSCERMALATGRRIYAQIKSVAVTV